MDLGVASGYTCRHRNLHGASHADRGRIPGGIARRAAGLGDGEGLVDDVTTHPATRAMVDEYVAWYDLHYDPAWQDTLLTPPGARSKRAPWAYVVPKSADDLSSMGRFFSATTFLSAGNITHTPCYGHMIALGILASVQERNVSPEQIANACRYREMIA